MRLFLMMARIRQVSGLVFCILGGRANYISPVFKYLWRVEAPQLYMHRYSTLDFSITAQIADLCVSGIFSQDTGMRITRIWNRLGNYC